MELNEYQKKIKKYDIFDQEKRKSTDLSFISKVLGLAEEAGEVTGKFKKIYRDDNGEISSEKKEEIIKELGDVLWYTATIARYLDVPFEEIANKNIKKLENRFQNNKIHGSGDNR